MHGLIFPKYRTAAPKPGVMRWVEHAGWRSRAVMLYTFEAGLKQAYV